MSDNMIITIGRQYGSGGVRVAQMLSEKLGLKVYDKNLIAEASKVSGISEDLFEKHDEKPTNSFLYSLVMDTYSFGYGNKTYNDMPMNHKLFLAQFDTIKQIAEKESCIILGRCADYALQDSKHLVSIFLTAPTDVRVACCEQMDKLSISKAKDKVKKIDKSRASYYNYYTDKKWGVGASYDLVINTHSLGIEKTADLIIDYVNKKFE